MADITHLTAEDAQDILTYFKDTYKGVAWDIRQFSATQTGTKRPKPRHSHAEQTMFSSIHEAVTAPDSHIEKIGMQKTDSYLVFDRDDIKELEKHGSLFTKLLSTGMVGLDGLESQVQPLAALGETIRTSEGSYFGCTVKFMTIRLTPEGVVNHPALLEQALNHKESKKERMAGKRMGKLQDQMLAGKLNYAEYEQEHDKQIVDYLRPHHELKGDMHIHCSLKELMKAAAISVKEGQRR